MLIGETVYENINITIHLQIPGSLLRSQKCAQDKRQYLQLFKSNGYMLRNANRHISITLYKMDGEPKNESRCPECYRSKNWDQAGTHWYIKIFSYQDTNWAQTLRPPIDIWGLINLKSSMEPMTKITVAKIQNKIKSASRMYK